jgi:hypothetical protein
LTLAVVLVVVVALLLLLLFFGLPFGVFDGLLQAPQFFILGGFLADQRALFLFKFGLQSGLLVSDALGLEAIQARSFL